MDATKKRKVDDNGVVSSDGGDADTNLTTLTPKDARKIIEKFNVEQLIDIVQSAALRHHDVLASVRSIADSDITQRKLFIRGLGWDTTTENLRNLFSQYGELEEAVVILDKATGKSKGYGFVTFKHVDGAVLALKEPSKKIDGRVTVTQLAAAGNSGQSVNSQDVSMRKIYVANVPFDMPSEKLCAHFSLYGEIEEGPLGYDKMTGKSKGFALFVYKTAEGAQAALVDPVKTIEGRQLNCKLAIEGKKKGGPQGGGQAGGGDGHGDGMGMGAPASMPGSMGGQYGGPGGMGSYGGFSGGLQGPPLGHHMNSSLQSSLGGPGLSSVGSQGASSLGGAGGYGSGLGGPYGGYGGPGSAGYGGLGGVGGGALGGAGAGAGAGLGGAGGGSSMYRLPPSSAGMPSGGYPESAHYNLSASTGFPSQHHQAAGTSPLPRVPPGGMYPNVPPYY